MAPRDLNGNKGGRTGSTARKLKLRRLLHLRLTVPELAERLNCSERTVKRDLAEFRVEDKAALAAITKYDIAAGIDRTTDYAVRRLVEIIEARVQPDDPRSPYRNSSRDRIAALLAMSKVEQTTVKLKQSLGIAPKVADKVEVEQVFFQRLLSLDSASLDQLDGLEGESLMRKMAEVLGPELTQAAFGTVEPLLLAPPADDEQLVVGEIHPLSEDDET